MNETSQKTETPRTWLERLSDALLREPQDRQQLVNLLRDAEQRNLLDANALMMIEGVLQVSEIQVRDIMVPRAQMIVVESTSDLSAILPGIIESAHSRFPVIGDSRDDILGILLAKDLLPFACNNEQPKRFNMREILRPAVYVPESKRLNVLLQEFRDNRNHMAIVVNEYGGVAGLVTIEDVLEQIVGEIADESDNEEATYIKQHSVNKYIIKALTPIEDFNEYFETTFNTSEYDTIAGLVAHEFGYLPKRGEQVQIENFIFKVLHADNRRIHLLQVNVLPKIIDQ
ncbi:MAG: HlyC/CorC family transporter [Gammaproteobacteria bacterium]